MSNQGIQQLLDAELRAHDIVAKARREKAEYLKKARDEAEKEINQYREDKERDFLKKFGDNNEDEENELALKFKRDAEDEIRDLNKNSQAHRNTVIKLILDSVMSVDYNLDSKQ